MADLPFKTALILGAGQGISASVARQLSAAGVTVALAARNAAKLADLAQAIGGKPFSVDAADPTAMAKLFSEVDAAIGAPEVVIYNASARAHGPIAELDPAAVAAAIRVTAFGGFLAVHHAAKRMLPEGRGAILLTGATASVKGFAHSAAFAMGKFALRGLAQSAAREFGPNGIHVAHIVVDGSVRSELRPDKAERPDGTLAPDGIAQTYLDVLRQPRDAWSMEVEVRPWTEPF